MAWDWTHDRIYFTDNSIKLGVLYLYEDIKDTFDHLTCPTINRVWALSSSLQTFSFSFLKAFAIAY